MTALLYLKFIVIRSNFSKPSPNVLHFLIWLVSVKFLRAKGSCMRLSLPPPSGFSINVPAKPLSSATKWLQQIVIDQHMRSF